MSGRLSWKLDEKTLSKKYRTDVNRLIRAWKKGLSDQEISFRTGIKPSILRLIRQDIELEHRRHRLAEKKQALAQGQAPGQYQIFFNPHL
ncbi:MAG TPA: hypothetical protein PKM06_09875 [Bacillota bacterium]|jgi:hypothetical protein|nr:hypothetical protein [Peptococcaceae bacterium MAG4]NLW38372.1 hypothetical protein [Peptococcaceae bacterium]HQD76809.1 hypothetical protein [Bacillota bacterium]HUM59517.1 hypothetical protein [Bacillota bacterium]